MRKKNLILLIIFFICYNSYGQFDHTKLKNHITYELNLQNMTLGETLNIISQESKVAIIPSDEIKDIILNTYFPADISLEDILNTFIQLYNLKLSKSGQIFILSKRGENNNFIFSGRVESEESKKGLERVKITLINSFSQPVFSTYDGYFLLNDIDPAVYIVKFEKEGYFPIIDLIDLTEMNKSINITMKRENKFFNREEKSSLKKDNTSYQNMVNGKKILTETIHIYNNNCEDIKKLLLETFGSLLKISSLPKKNILLLSGEEEIIKSSKALIADLDSDMKQIRIDAQILDVTNNLFENLGFNWIYNNNENLKGNEDWNFSLLGSSSVTGLGNAYSSAISISKQFNAGSDILNLGINLLESTQDLVVSSRPSILVLDGEEGSFKVAEEVIVGEQKEEDEDNNRVITTPIFREAGVILKVTPTIRKDGWVILKVLIEISNFKLKINKDEAEDSGTYNSEGGSKIGRSIETTIKIRDGETIFIGGLKKATVHNLNSQIPFFGTLPMIDIFFKNQNISHEISDIYIKMKVNIVNNETDSFERDEIHQRAKDIINRKIY
ncbi:Pullulanase secretion envelope pulD [Fusobacterium necrogenes]|uniref:Pullulanase secretion envelope pulD n=1 Tax=Fusobacterium necrogenes TaxID=858 RepID=A0A377GVZ9_9FUSO|nr:general secretion pathway protein GspD [Fusobacterium necrogenes]STO30701.1 Pullulanase secretion envelope pulD [Fusobacterium necrogenes]